MPRVRARWMAVPVVAMLAGCSLLASSDFSDFQGAPGVDGAAPIDSFVPTSEAACGTACVDSDVAIASDATADADAGATADSGVLGPTTRVFQRSDGGTPVFDTVIRQGSPTTTGGGETTLQADFEVTGSGGSAIVLMRFDVSSIPVGNKVSSAVLTLNITDQTSGTTPFLLYPLLRSWSEAEATWNLAANGVSWNFAGTRATDAGPLDRKATSIGSLRPLAKGVLDVPFDAAGIAQVQSWVDDPSSNYGFAFDTKDNSDAILFTSSETSTPPQLKITFTPPGADGG